MFVVAVEVKKEGNAPHMLYVTFGDFGSPVSGELFAEKIVLDYLKNTEGTKEVKSVYRLPEDQYFNILENQLKEYALKDE